MRKLSIILVVVLASVVAVVLAGCGCSDKSDKSDNQNSTTNQTTTSNQTSNANGSSSSTDSGSATSFEQRKAVKFEDYINSKNFDLDGYTKALGFTKLTDPKGGIIYATKIGNTKCFFGFADHVIITWFDNGDGYTYQTDPINITTSSDAYIIDIGSKEGQQQADQKGLDRITRVLSYIATAEHIEINQIPVFRSIFKLEGSPKYYPNGVIQETSSNIVETIHVNNP